MCNKQNEVTIDCLPPGRKRYNCKDLTGRKFHKLSVLYASHQNISDLSMYWVCLCDCGNEVIKKTSQLTRSSNASCGCGKLKDITGKRFGLLTAVRFLRREQIKDRILTYWLFKCDCGGEREVSITSLPKIKSCGCIQHIKAKANGQKIRKHHPYKEISGEYWKSIQNSAARRGIIFNVSIEYIWSLFLTQRKRCALTGVEIKFGDNKTASLDRIDSSVGYIEGNLQWVHKRINKLKGDFNEGEFLSWCREAAIFESQEDKYHPLSYDNHFLGLAFVISRKSSDIHSQHGCVLTSNNIILSTGFNDFYEDTPEDLRFVSRPAKYIVMEHAEEAAVRNLRINPWVLPTGANAYITAHPCPRCAQILANANVKTWYVMDKPGTKLEDEQSRIDFNKIVQENNIRVIYLKSHDENGFYRFTYLDELVKDLQEMGLIYNNDVNSVQE